MLLRLGIPYSSCFQGYIHSAGHTSACHATPRVTPIPNEQVRNKRRASLNQADPETWTWNVSVPNMLSPCPKRIPFFQASGNYEATQNHWILLLFCFFFCGAITLNHPEMIILVGKCFGGHFVFQLFSRHLITSSLYIYIVPSFTWMINARIS